MKLPDQPQLISTSNQNSRRAIDIQKLSISRLTFRKIRFKLESAGFDEVKQLGNHAKFVKRENDRIITAVLPHYQQIAPGVLHSIIRQSGLSVEEFEIL
jgi:predicted RNA binding protein YcfA (HicA-like mRNA interferase family)